MNALTPAITFGPRRPDHSTVLFARRPPAFVMHPSLSSSSQLLLLKASLLQEVLNLCSLLISTGQHSSACSVLDTVFRPDGQLRFLVEPWLPVIT